MSSSLALFKHNFKCNSPDLYSLQNLAFFLSFFFSHFLFLIILLPKPVFLNSRQSSLLYVFPTPVLQRKALQQGHERRGRRAERGLVGGGDGRGVGRGLEGQLEKVSSKEKEEREEQRK